MTSEDNTQNKDNELTEKDIPNILYVCLNDIQNSLKDMNKTLNEINGKLGQINQQILNKYILDKNRY